MTLPPPFRLSLAASPKREVLPPYFHATENTPDGRAAFLLATARIASHLKDGIKNRERDPYFAFANPPVIDRHPVEAAVRAVTQAVKDFSMLVDEASA